MEDEEAGRSLAEGMAEDRAEGARGVEDGQNGSDGEERTHCRDPARRRMKVRGRADSTSSN